MTGFLPPMRVVLAACLTVVAVDAGAVTISISASRDATIFQNSPNNGSGAGNGLFAGTNGMSSPRRALLAFDIASQVPANAVIQSVQLNLVLGQVAGGGMGGGSEGPTIGLHRVSASWGESTTLQSQPPTDSPAAQGQGAAAVTGDVTWASRFHGATPATPWTTAGGDFAATASATTVVGTTTNSTYSWISTASLVSDVQAWLNAPSTNFGWMLANVDEASPTTFRAFYSRNVATQSFQPQLSITYAIPEPGSFVLGITAMMLTAAMHKARRA